MSIFDGMFLLQQRFQKNVEKWNHFKNNGIKNLSVANKWKRMKMKRRRALVAA
ncbi:MAG: hypothetical protein WC397_00295 [Candidatus Paceibacterota bacterium]|jgi:hypothetical protein